MPHLIRWPEEMHIFSLLFLLVIFISCVELPLLAYRAFLGVNPAYPWVSALIRTVAYSPCYVVLHIFVGMMMPLGCALFGVLWGESDLSDISWFYGVPEAVVALTCFSISYTKRKRMIAKVTANQPPLPTPGKCPPSKHDQLPGAADL